MKAPNAVARAATGLLLSLAAVSLLFAAGRVEKWENEESKEEKLRGDQPDEALKFRHLQMQDENGRIPLDAFQRAREQMAVMRAAQEHRRNTTGNADVALISPGSWTWLGPGNVGGRIRSIVIDPADANKMWVGSVGGGIWRTTNAGTIWAPVNDFMANLAVSTMVVNPSNSAIMYAGTGEGYSNSDALQGGGIFQSTDSGATWNLLPSTNPASAPTPGCGVGAAPCPPFWSYVTRMSISPNGSVLLAATNDPVNSPPVNGIAQSTDGGATWTQRFNGRVMEIDFHPNNNTQAVAGGLGNARYSTDGGQTWTAATFTPPITTGAFATNGRVELAYAPSNPLIVYAAVNNNNGDLFRSTDSGQSFTRVNTGTNFFLGSGNQGWYDNVVWVNPQDPTFVIVGGIDLWRSTDSGSTFTQISQWQSAPTSSAHADQHVILAHSGFNNSTNRVVYFGNDGGIYRADDVSTVSQTTGWTNLNNTLGITQFYSAAVNSSGVFIGGAQDNGNNRRDTSGGTTWTAVTGMEGDGGFCASDPTDPNYFYGEYINLDVRRSTDGGLSGVSISTGILDVNNGANFIAPFILDPNDPNRMLAGGLSLWRSNNIKATPVPSWTSAKPAATPRPAVPPSPTPGVSAIAISANNSDLVVVGHNDGQIFLTFNGTAAMPIWSQINGATTPTRFVARLVIDETRSPNWIYATFGGFAGDNIYRTTDLGVTWSDVSGSGSTSLPSVPVRSLAIHPVRPDFLYAGTEVGVFASEDAGASWMLPQDGPANVSVDELLWKSGRLVAVTHGRGLYETSLSIYDASGCVPPPGCACFGRWDCACSWSDNHVPNVNEDVGILCQITIASDQAIAAQARSLVVKRGATLIVNKPLGLVEDLINYGVVTGNTSFSTVSARNIVNFRPENAITTNGTMSLSGTVSASGDITNTGDFDVAGTIGATGDLSNSLVMHSGADVNCRNLTTAGNSTLTLAGSLRVKANMTNAGALQGNALVLNSNPPGAHTFSGAGPWTFSTFPIVSPYTVSLGSDVTFDIADFSNSGTLQLQNRTLNFRGINSFMNANGVVSGTGTFRFAPSDGTVVFAHQGTNFTPAVVIASGIVEFHSGGTLSGPLTVDAGATFGMNTTGTLTLANLATINGSLTKIGSSPVLEFNGLAFTNNGVVGDLSFLTFNSSGTTLAQTISGPGSWAPQTIQVGNNPPSNTTLTLANDISFSGANLTVFNGSTLNVGSNTFTLTGPTNFVHPGAVTGTGLVRMQPISGTPIIGNQFVSSGAFAPSLEIATGTVRLYGMTIDSNLTINPAATLSLVSFGPTVKGNVLVNGILNVFNGSPIFTFLGSSFTNSGTVSGSTLIFGNAAMSYSQNLAGAGTWAGTPNLILDSHSTTTLLSDVTYNGNVLTNNGRIETGSFFLSLPCTVGWSGTGDVVGNIRRTNLGACAGPVAFGNPFTTIQFTSGTAPTEVTVNVALGAPVGFSTAVQRSYLITPTGGSGYTATLRLHYLDSELNGNNESTMQLYRNDGSSWNAQGVTNRDTTNNWVEYSGVTQFSPWTISSLTPPPPPTPTPTPTATPVSVSISGTILSCANPTPAPNQNVTLTLTGTVAGSVTSDVSGNYLFSGLTPGGSYTVTPAKASLVPGGPGSTINTVDVVGAQRHLLLIAALTGCRLSAGDVNGDLTVNTVDVIAIQRFNLGLTTGIANVGQYRFIPASRSYSGLVSDQVGQNFDSYIIGDVAAPFGARNTGPVPDAPSLFQKSAKSRSKN